MRKICKTVDQRIKPRGTDVRIVNDQKLYGLGEGRRGVRTFTNLRIAGF